VVVADPGCCACCCCCCCCCCVAGFKVHPYYEDFSSPCFAGLHHMVSTVSCLDRRYTPPTHNDCAHIPTSFGVQTHKGCRQHQTTQSGSRERSHLVFRAVWVQLVASAVLHMSSRLQRCDVVHG
jgi:hypothetical protein